MSKYGPHHGALKETREALQENRYVECLEHAAVCLSMSPPLQDAHALKAEALLHLGRFKEAESPLKRACAFNSTWARGALLLRMTGIAIGIPQPGFEKQVFGVRIHHRLALNPS